VVQPDRLRGRDALSFAERGPTGEHEDPLGVSVWSAVRVAVEVSGTNTTAYFYEAWPRACSLRHACGGPRFEVFGNGDLPALASRLPTL
jgi:hypothetical protein